MLNFKNYILSVVILIFCYPAVVQAGVVPNDDCTAAIAVSVPSVTMGSTIGASLDLVPLCGTPVFGPGVWYTVTGTGHTMTASLCQANGGTANYDTNMHVYSGDCPEPLSDCCVANGSDNGCDDSTCLDTVCSNLSHCCVGGFYDSFCAEAATNNCGDLCSAPGFTCLGGNDDTCGAASQVSWCSQVGATYRILIDGWRGATGNFTLAISDDGCPCGQGGVCESCEEAQQEAQNAVESGGPYRNHGQLVSTAAKIADTYLESGEITEECDGCIVSQFAHGIPIDEQKVCADSGP
jgi:hypothetical protein